MDDQEILYYEFIFRVKPNAEETKKVDSSNRKWLDEDDVPQCKNAKMQKNVKLTQNQYFGLTKRF